MRRPHARSSHYAVAFLDLAREAGAAGADPAPAPAPPPPSPLPALASSRNFRSASFLYRSISSLVRVCVHGRVGRVEAQAGQHTDTKGYAGILFSSGSTEPKRSRVHAAHEKARALALEVELRTQESGCTRSRQAACPHIF